MKRFENLEYIMNVVDDLFDASNGDVFPGISKEELNEVMQLVEERLLKPAKNAPLANKVTSMMIYSMSGTEETTGNISAAAPDFIQQTVSDIIYDETNDEQLADKISEAAFELASSLVKEPGQYL